ncbi:ABC transporter permease [Candidatus Pyrohabitans sp.]
MEEEVGKVENIFTAHYWRLPFWRLLRPYAVILAFIILWELVASMGIFPPYILPKFSTVMKSLFSSLYVENPQTGFPFSGDLIPHTLWSIWRVLVGWGLGILLAVPLGVIMGWSKNMEAVLNPLIEAVRPIPPLAWIPLAVIWFGLGFTSTVFIVFLGAFFPILLNTIHGVKSVDKTAIEFAQTLGASQRQILYKVVLPSALPSIFTGMRIGMGIAWMTVVAAEMIAAKYGLGYMIWFARHQFDTALIIGGMITIGVVSISMVTLMMKLEDRLFKWRKGMVVGG